MFSSLKICGKCKKNLNLSHFPYLTSNIGFGLEKYCKECIDKAFKRINTPYKSKYRYKTIIINKEIKRNSRYIMEQHLNRELTSKEMVHHIDRNTLNDNLINLYLCKDRNEHAAIHKHQNLIKLKLKILGVSSESYL